MTNEHATEMDESTTELQPTSKPSLEGVLFPEMKMKAGREDERLPTPFELAHEARRVGPLVRGQLAWAVENSPTIGMWACMLPAVISVRSFVRSCGIS